MLHRPLILAAAAILPAALRLPFAAVHRLLPRGAVAVLLLLLAASPASSASFTLRHNTGATALRGDNYATQNKNVVWTPGGLFRSGDLQTGWPTYHPSDNVVVQRSTDGGVNWTQVFDTGVHRDNLKPPSIEADAAGNVYIVYPSSSTSTRFVKFSPSNNYSAAVVNSNSTAAGSGSKFTSAFDPGQDRLYHGTQNGRLLTYNTSGGVTANRHLITSGGSSRPSYPHVMVDEFGVIHYAMTVADDGDDVPYTDIRYLKSLDGGQTWRAMNNTVVTTPTPSAGATSRATLINRSGEHNYASWLSNMHVKDGKVHFTYQTRNPWVPAGAGNPPSITPYMSYIRYDEATGTREIDRTTLAGNSYAVNSEAASFASDTSNSSGALYVVGERLDGKRLQALVSYDNGQTWQDYAQSAFHDLIANPSLARSVTPSGKVIGGVALDDPNWAWVNHLELPTVQDTTTIAYWDGGGEVSAWNTGGNWVGDVAPTFDNKLAVAIGSGSSTAKVDTMRINDDRTIRALIFGTFADANVNLGLKSHDNQSRTLRFESNVAGDSAEINVHHDATGNIDIGGGDALGNIVLNDPLRVKHDGRGTLSISRPISGAHGITKSGPGQFILSGAAANTFSGTTTVSGGKLILNKSAGAGAIGGNLTIAPSSGWANAANGVELAANEQIANSAVISFTGTDFSGFRLKGYTETVGGLVSPSGKGVIENSGLGQTVATDGTLIINTADGTSYTYDGFIRDRDGGSSAGKLNLTKTGLGTQIFHNGNISYTGTTTVSQGTLRVSGTGRISSTAVVDADGTLIFGTSNAYTWNGTLTGSGTVQIDTPSTPRTGVSGNNAAFAGTVDIPAGMRLDVHTEAASSASAHWVVDGTLSVPSSNTTVNLGKLSGSGEVGQGGGATGLTFVIGAKGEESTFDGRFHSDASVVKTGAGTLTLSGSNTYTGPTSISAGTLLVNGSLANTSSMTIAAGGVLGGSGSIVAALAGAGFVSPGNSAGILTASAVDSSAGLGFAFEFTQANADPTWSNATASGNDVLRLTAGGSPFTGPLGATNTVNVFLGVTSLTLGDTFTGGFFTDASVDFLADIQNATFAYYVVGDGGGSTIFHNGTGYYSLAQFDSTLSIDAATIQIGSANFAAGAVSNGYSSQFSVVPEPGSLTLLGLTAAVAVLRLRLRLGRHGSVPRENLFPRRINEP